MTDQVARLPPTAAGRLRRTLREATPRPSCPWCGASTSHITLSRCDLIRDAFRRRRRCAECGKRWPTVEGLDVERFTRELQRLGLTLADVGLPDERRPRDAD